jgi:hypothetical protein
VRPDGFDLAAYWERSVQRFRGGLPRYRAQALVHASVCARLEQTRYVRVVAWLRPGVGAAAGGDVGGHGSGGDGGGGDASGRADGGAPPRRRRDAADWLPAELEFHTLESARDIALGFGGRIVILAPAELRAALREAIHELAALYAET